MQVATASSRSGQRAGRRAQALWSAIPPFGIIVRVTTAAGKADRQAHGRPDEEKERLTALGGLAALSLDALSSVAYGPEAILLVLVTAGASALKYSLPITGAIVVLLAALVISYRQVIEAFPNGGGAYAVSKTHLGTTAVAGRRRRADRRLHTERGRRRLGGSRGADGRVPVAVRRPGMAVPGVLAAITGANLWGVAESARLFMAPTLAFIVSIFAVIIIGLLRGQPAVPLVAQPAAGHRTVGALLILKAFASGCSALTGVEAIANSVPQFRRPRVKRAQHTEVGLGLLLGLMLLGLGALIRHWNAVPQPGTTVLAQLTEGAVGHNVIYYIIQLVTLVLLALAANTSFGGLPVLAGLLAHDNFLPHVFGLRADRRVFRYGVGVLAVAAALLLIVVRGDTQELVPLFAVGVFIGFTLSQVGMVKHWHLQRASIGRAWLYKAFVNGVGAVLTFAATVIELASKFLAGAWLVAIVIPLLVVMFMAVARAYARIGVQLAIGQVPPPPVKQASLVIVPVVGHVQAHRRGDLGRDVARRRRDRGDRGVHRLRRPTPAPRRVLPPGVAAVAAGGAAAHAPLLPPLAGQADRVLPAGGRGGGQVPPPGGADPRGGADPPLAGAAAQPARRNPGPRDPPGHQERRPVPPPLPPGDPGRLPDRRRPAPTRREPAGSET